MQKEKLVLHSLFFCFSFLIHSSYYPFTFFAFEQLSETKQQGWGQNISKTDILKILVKIIIFK